MRRYAASYLRNLALCARRACALALLILAPALACAAEVSLRILHFNDVYQYTLPGQRGGLARLATRVAAERASHDDTLVTFGGDQRSPSVASSLTHGPPKIEMMNALGVDVAVLGNHEFDYGPAVLKERLAESRFPWLAANVHEKNSGEPFPGTRAYVVRELHGVKIAVVGVVTEKTARRSRAGPEDVFDDPVRSAAQLAARLRRERIADVVIALTHLDVAQDRELARSGTVDLILGGHDHEAISERVDGVPILKASSEARNVQVIALAIDDERRKVASIESVLEAVDGEPYPALQALIRRYDAMINEGLSTVIGETDTALDARKATVRSGESGAGNLVADAFREVLGADIGIVNGGGMRLDAVLEPGPITRRDIKKLLPLENHVYKLRVPGADLVALFDHLAAGLGAAPVGQYPHVSGMRVVLAPQRPSGQRVVQLEVAGKPVAPDRSYNVAVSDFLASGRNQYDVLKSAPRLMSEDAAPLETTVVMDFIERRKQLHYDREERVQVRD
jgi:5'-nucleotidase